MRKIKAIKYIGILLLGIAFASCEDSLDLQPISEETVDNAYATGTQLEAALTGVYESFQSNDYYVWDKILFEDVRSDNHYAGGDNPQIFEIDNLNISTTNDRVFNAWSAIYNAISKANLVIERAPLIERDITDEQRRQFEGQALFLRAYHYFNLVKLWGGVPLITETVKSVAPGDVRLPRNSAEEVYNQIITDLENALDLLPHTYGNDASVNKARATKGAANALLAKVHAQRPNPNYGAVLEHANAVINSPAGYSLLSNYDLLFNGNNYNNQESILEIQYLGGDEGTWGPQMHLPPSVSGDTWRKFVTPSKDLVEAFDSEGDDVRKNATMLFEAVPWIDEYWGNSVNSQVPFAYKWRNASGWASADNDYILRLADIILLKAEALNELGQPAEAAAQVNIIRNRVSLPDLENDISASVNSMRAAILKERRLELAQEAQRWSDLVRYGVMVETMNSVDDIDLRTNQPVNYNASQTDVLLPIPQNEINRNPQLTQNPGY
ncbi:RagB/SusD family nutrient uptake outer membrane protein [Antarcticibacterium flavum]|uniref:RagB/SusD family nutrient uptake outer membrane protein n=1 Tax=Antarcticibacterium flavum TaxID=2058175 RepID=A0A5B7X7N2_9FLAO|nr:MULTISPECIES: RagB/SusD family nutrient uptake outer membrane protein [Antarcticibacterium]MCM4160875.1 RagB/SusD family nutrient uptake outer membrane protein [Antarcticibacterium sp. W02-3]QCY71100.1 RagB/SusD family nutrient uptake outer membrane protein [Antarcticibacterium flavum]